MITLLATGGTISMQRSAEAGGNVPALDGRGLLALAGDLGAEVRIEDWERLPAVHRGPDQLWALRNRIAELVRNGSSGVVVAHGTDTLEEVAYLLARTLPAGAPIVLTGAMRTSSDADWDGPRNLRDAVRVAGAPMAVGRGALVVFAGSILDGLEAAKLHTSSPQAFGSPHTAPLGTVDPDGVWFAGPPPAPPRLPLEPRALTARAALIPLSIGDDGTLLDLARPHYDGVVIEAFGGGNAPPGIVPAVERWLAERKPVVLASRCPFGEVGGEYAFPGGGGHLLRLGVMPAGPRTPALARFELELSLSAGVPYGGYP
ncbi:MAG: asparaginase [Gemmatimonadales bacterium]